ncbi:unnamed protein product [Cuscuta campestris]|uniref:Uncharacterized protein n=1 Tax=Cuscuta campestris TaxID=132261 RepID=A0A484LTA3_9ASTE|nr:unnamed protein product [Cuscuta campestris]
MQDLQLKDVQPRGLDCFNVHSRGVRLRLLRDPHGKKHLQKLHVPMLTMAELHSNQMEIKANPLKERVCRAKKTDGESE